MKNYITNMRERRFTELLESSEESEPGQLWMEVEDKKYKRHETFPIVEEKRCEEEIGGSLFRACDNLGMINDKRFRI